ncbi:MAG: GatB/YqeY domain-containing protein [Thermocrispum sp.]
MRVELRAGLTAAIKAKDRVGITALRSALAAIDNAEAVPVESAPASLTGREHVAGGAAGLAASEAERKELTADVIHAIVEREVADSVLAAEEYARLGRDDQAERLRAEAAVLSRYLAG